MFQSYGSVLPTSLGYILPSTRGVLPWRPDAVLGTVVRHRWTWANRHGLCWTGPHPAQRRSARCSPLASAAGCAILQDNMVSPQQAHLRRKDNPSWHEPMPPRVIRVARSPTVHLRHMTGKCHTHPKLAPTAPEPTGGPALCRSKRGSSHGAWLPVNPWAIAVGTETFSTPAFTPPA